MAYLFSCRDACSPILWALLGLCFVVGCAPSGPKQPVVKGSVSIDGQPLADGTIVFMGTDAAALRSEANIKNGEFAFNSPAGPKKVEIRSRKKVGTTTTESMPGEDIYEESLPAKFNSASELTAIVEKNGTTLNFDLKSN